ncbi:hypothetical protein QPX96_00100 [Limosilactobacillus fermentum]|nr:hypothetical protein [Limosilactobacillus fermentum]
MERSAPRDQAKPTLVFCQLADWPTFAKRYGGSCLRGLSGRQFGSGPHPSSGNRPAT